MARYWGSCPMCGGMVYDFGGHHERYWCSGCGESWYRTPYIRPARKPYIGCAVETIYKPERPRLANVLNMASTLIFGCMGVIASLYLLIYEGALPGVLGFAFTVVTTVTNIVAFEMRTQ